MVVQSGDEVAGAGSWKEGVKVTEKESVCGRVKLWPRVLREEAVRTLRCGGRR